jgi:hypothetical protein
MSTAAVFPPPFYSLPLEGEGRVRVTRLIIADIREQMGG